MKNWKEIITNQRTRRPWLEDRLRYNKKGVSNYKNKRNKKRYRSNYKIQIIKERISLIIQEKFLLNLMEINQCVDLPKQTLEINHNTINLVRVITVIANSNQVKNYLDLKADLYLGPMMISNNHKGKQGLSQGIKARIEDINLLLDLLVAK